MRSSRGQIALSVLICLVITAVKAEAFDFKKQLFDPPTTLSTYLQSVDQNTGEITIYAWDTQGLAAPFTWDWGDGCEPESGWSPRQHTYVNLTENYIITVTAHYTGGGTDTAEVVIHFAAPQISPINLPTSIEVTIPDSNVTLTSRMGGYYPPSTLTHFDDSFFVIVPRATVEYVLTAAAYIENDLVNSDVADVGGGFQQVVLRDPCAGGMYSLWYTSPVSFGAGDYAFGGTIEYSSFMHEMGHNFTLNSPANYYYGGKIDGNANAIYSESMAQIFQHAAAYEIIENGEYYGLSEDLICDIKNSAISSMQLVRSSYEEYVAGGAHFYSWNNPSTPGDETFGTFMTIAYKFFEQAENSGKGYRMPLKRMMKLLQMFDVVMKNRYDRLHNNTAADTFRSTLMVAAVSYGFETDLRADFEALNFPIDDATYDELIMKASEPIDLDNDRRVTLSDLGIMCEDWLADGPQIGSDFNDDKAVNFSDFAIMAEKWLTAEWQPQPISHWKFDEGSGTIAHDSAGINDGTINGATWTTGKTGDALQFDGIDDWVDLGTDIFSQATFASSGATISVWVYPKANLDNRAVVVGIEGRFAIAESSSMLNRWEASIYDGDTQKIASTSAIDVNEWVHLAATWDTTTLRFYVNGVSQGSVLQGTPLIDAVSRPVTAGAYYDGSLYYTIPAIIDDIRIYNEALSVGEIAYLCGK
ncbi:MAG: LamG domain-containing protein [Sedimentisphaerales bacterium]|nr:LamG domain-containing protein [Sedimentisphaerales bacterium]